MTKNDFLEKFMAAIVVMVNEVDWPKSGKSIDERLWEALRQIKDEQDDTPEGLRDALEFVGLKIVEK